MNPSDFTEEQIKVMTAYMHVLRDGGHIGYRDITLCDLRNHVYSKRNRRKPMIQVHKLDLGGEEYSELFDNYVEGIDKYRGLMALEKTKPPRRPKLEKKEEDDGI